MDGRQIRYSPYDALLIVAHSLHHVRHCPYIFAVGNVPMQSQLRRHRKRLEASHSEDCKFDSKRYFPFVSYSKLLSDISYLCGVARSRLSTSTCSVVHESMLRDLTLEIWVPSLRCNPAHRMHMNMPSYK